MQKVFRIFAQNLAYYNEGNIEGGWLNLPQPQEVIDRYLRDIVKVDETHEEYEVADVENIYPFSYDSIQWASVKAINNLAIIYGSLNKFEKEAVGAYLESEDIDKYGIHELANICLQVGKIEYYQYSFKGIEYSKDCSVDVKMGYTMAEESGLYYELEKLGVIDYFDFEKYGESYSYNFQLLENGYLVEDSNININFYSKEEIQEKAGKILKENMKEKEVREIEI